MKFKLEAYGVRVEFECADTEKDLDIGRALVAKSIILAESTLAMKMKKDLQEDAKILASAGVVNKSGAK